MIQCTTLCSREWFILWFCTSIASRSMIVLFPFNIGLINFCCTHSTFAKAYEWKRLHTICSPRLKSRSGQWTNMRSCWVTQSMLRLEHEYTESYNESATTTVWRTLCHRARVTQCLSEKNQSIYCFIKLKMEVQKKRGTRTNTKRWWSHTDANQQRLAGCWKIKRQQYSHTKIE